MRRVKINFQVQAEKDKQFNAIIAHFGKFKSLFCSAKAHKLCNGTDSIYGQCKCECHG